MLFVVCFFCALCFLGHLFRWKLSVPKTGCSFGLKEHAKKKHAIRCAIKKGKSKKKNFCASQMNKNAARKKTFCCLRQKIGPTYGRDEHHSTVVKRLWLAHSRTMGRGWKVRGERERERERERVDIRGGVTSTMGLHLWWGGRDKSQRRGWLLWSGDNGSISVGAGNKSQGGGDIRGGDNKSKGGDMWERGTSVEGWHPWHDSWGGGGLSPLFLGFGSGHVEFERIKNKLLKTSHDFIIYSLCWFSFRSIFLCCCGKIHSQCLQVGCM